MCFPIRRAASRGSSPNFRWDAGIVQPFALVRRRSESSPASSSHFGSSAYFPRRIRSSRVTNRKVHTHMPPRGSSENPAGGVFFDSQRNGPRSFMRSARHLRGKAFGSEPTRTRDACPPFGSMLLEEIRNRLVQERQLRKAAAIAIDRAASVAGEHGLLDSHTPGLMRILQVLVFNRASAE